MNKMDPSNMSCVEFLLPSTKHSVSGWQGKLVSSAGKATLIQLVAQAVPLYAMSCLKFPKTFVNDLNIIIAKFW